MRRLTTSALGLFLKALTAAACLFVAPVATKAQQCADETDVQGHTVHSIRVQSRFNRVPDKLKQKLAAHRGESYSTDKGTQYAREVKEYIASEATEVDDALGLTRLKKFSIRAGLYTWCLERIPDAQCRADIPGASHCIDIVIRSKAIQLDMLDVGGNLLPIPRSNRLNFYREIPAPLVALNPAFVLTNDRELGVAPGFSISTDLLNLNKDLELAKAAPANPDELRLNLQASKSLNEPFYDTRGTLSYRRNRAGKTIESAWIGAWFEATRSPRAEQDYFRTAGSLEGGIGLRPTGSVLNRLNFAGGYRWSDNQFFNIDQTEHAFHGRVVADARIAGGFARGAAWADGASTNSSSYQRLSAAVGYEKELVVGENKAVGLELILGGGKTFGAAPSYARFVGGTWAGNFLYDSIESPVLGLMPAGPLIRSGGRGQIVVRDPSGAPTGANRYWHANLNLSIPIPGLARPLIPADVISERTDSAGVVHRTTLKDALKSQVNNGKILFIKARARQRLTPEQQEALSFDESDPLTPEERERLRLATAAYQQAQRDIAPEADRLWKEITPVTNFIADQANLLSIKPMFMFDAARLYAENGLSPRARFAAGGGVQLTVVIARFEAGYLRALDAEPGIPRGNFVVRLVFRNLF